MAVAVPPTRAPDKGTKTLGLPQEHEKPKPRKATAAGSTDGFCHWYVNRSRTLCGISHEALSLDQFHREAPCPNGCPPCPLCVAEFRDGS